MKRAPALTCRADARLWFVCFPFAATPAAWWQRPLRPGFRHVFAVRAEGGDRTLLADHAGGRLVLEVLAVPLMEALTNMRRELRALILAANEPTTPDRPRLRGPMTCVELVKSLLGVRAWWVLTPRHLWRHLRAQGARVIV